MNKKIIIAIIVVVAAAVSVALLAGKNGGLGGKTREVANPVKVAAKPNCGREYRILADAFKEPEAVCNLNLFNSGLTQIPPDINKFVNLERLNLAGNKLKAIPPELFSLAKLQVVYLGNNEISEIPSGIGKLENLTFLSLFVGKITALPPELGNLKKLTFLGLTGNPIGKDERAKIKSWLPKTEIKF